MRRRRTALAALLVVTALASGCGGRAPGAAGRAPATAPGATASTGCGEVQFTSVVRGDLLTALSPPVVYQSGTRPDVAVPQIATPVAAVGGDLPPDVYGAFAAYLGTDLPPLGTVYAVAGTRPVPAAGPGRFVLFSSVRTVTATASVRCGTATRTGPVSTWTTGNEGIFQCDISPPPAPLAQTLTQRGCAGQR